MKQSICLMFPQATSLGSLIFHSQWLKCSLTLQVQLNKSEYYSQVYFSQQLQKVKLMNAFITQSEMFQTFLQWIRMFMA